MARITHLAQLEAYGRDAPRTPAQGTEPAIDADSEHVARVGAKAWSRVAAAWDLKNRDAASLVDVSPRTWARMRGAGWSGRLSQDQLLRISALVGLFKGLHLYFSEPLADQWVGLRNSGPPFLGRTPLEVMSADGLPGILAVRHYVDALRGGL